MIMIELTFLGNGFEACQRPLADQHCLCLPLRYLQECKIRQQPNCHPCSKAGDLCGGANYSLIWSSNCHRVMISPYIAMNLSDENKLSGPLKMVNAFEIAFDTVRGRLSHILQVR